MKQNHIIMPGVATRFDDLGVGFAPYLQPPPEGVIRWTVGEPGFETPDPVISTAISELKAGKTKYTRGQGSIKLCEAVSSHLMSTSGISYSSENIVITPGAKQALLYAYMTTLNPGDEAILLTPCWASYEPMISIIGATPVNIPVNRTNFHPDIGAIRSAVTDKTRSIMVNSPCNPTGAVYTRQEIEEIVAIAVEHDLWIISDEIYSRLIWNGTDHVSPATIEGGLDRTIVISGWSKTWAMTGMRIGFLAGPSNAAKAAVKCQANSASHVPTFMMEAARAALDCDDYVDDFADAYRKRRDMMLRGLGDIPGLRIVDPEGAFYLFVDVTGTGMTDVEFADRALEAGVQLIPASLITHGEGFVRISYAAPEEDIKEGISRLRLWLLGESKTD
tara:strand:+ start:3600 stop:4769 length:1170 start_codon:yes stop_codon:yes gene_type:complete